MKRDIYETLTVLMLISISSAQVYATQSEEDGRELAPRTLEVLDVGYKLPIQIVAVRNLRNRQHWVRDLELEIRNVSTKPIYEIYFTVFLPDDKDISGASYAVWSMADLTSCIPGSVHRPTTSPLDREKQSY